MFSYDTGDPPLPGIRSCLIYKNTSQKESYFPHEYKGVRPSNDTKISTEENGMKYVGISFLAIAVLVILIGIITPVGIGSCAIVAAILAGLGAFIEIKRKQIQ